MKVIKEFSAKIVAFQTNILLTLVYIIILPIVWVLYKIFQNKKQDGWRQWSIKSDTVIDILKQ